jgi:hypothetical protein
LNALTWQIDKRRVTLRTERYQRKAMTLKIDVARQQMMNATFENWTKCRICFGWWRNTHAPFHGVRKTPGGGPGVREHY